VLDLTRVLAGPVCTQLLGDMGADTIKIESPRGGDESRGWGPFWNGIGCYFLSANRNKKSVAIDLKHEAGHEIALALAKRSDVVIENFRPGAVKRLGLDYETLAELNPQLIYCSLSGFGQDGPRAQEPAYDLLMQGFAGLMGLTGYPDGPPARAGLPVADFSAALFAASGILAALFCREREGHGQKVETSLMEGQLSWFAYYVIGYLATGVVPRSLGGGHHQLTPYQVYKAQDDYFVLAVGNDALWQRLCLAIDAPELAKDPRFVTNVERVAHRDALDALLGKLFQRHTAAEWIERISKAGVPCGPINTVDRIVADPQVQHVGTIQSAPHREIPDLKLCGMPITFSQTPGAIQSPPPLLGEHTDEVLSKLGYSTEQIGELRSAGVVV